MLFHHPVALREVQTAREPAAELAKRLPVAVAHDPQVQASLTRRPLGEPELTDPRQIGAELLGRDLLGRPVEPDGSLARDSVVDSVDEVPGHLPAVLGPADARRP